MTLRAFLRYGTRHSLYFSRDHWLPRLDPLCSSSHSKSGKRTWNIEEPRWAYRLRQRWFCQAGRQRCGRRDDVFVRQANRNQLPDTWDWMPDGNRTCSFCGSIHPDDLMAICKKALTDERYSVEGTTKSYKVYLRQPGVRNASEGAIKFYMHHAPKDPAEGDRLLFAKAVKLSRDRFAKELADWRACGAANAGS